MYHYKTIKIEINNRVGVIEFNRPEVMNAFNEKMIKVLRALLSKETEDVFLLALI